jgi:vacuolar-type H+-ATPase subunit F/Vma7
LKKTKLLRWKAHFFLGNNEVTSSENNYGLQSKNYAPPVREIKAFEDDLVKLTSNIRFRNVADPFLSKVQEDIKNINSSQKVVILAVKSTNVTKPLQKIIEKHLRTILQKVTRSVEMNASPTPSTRN